MRSNWQVKKLDELCDIARGGSPRPIKEFITDAPDGVNWIKISDATASSKYIYETKQKIKPEGIKRSRLVHDGDFLLSNSMSFGRPYIMRTSGCIHDGWLVLGNISESLDHDYLYYFLGSPEAYQQFDDRASGSTVRNLNIDLVRSVQILVPPIEDQKRIVAILDEAFYGIDTAIANTEKNLVNARELFESYLSAIFSQKSNGWIEKSLDEECEILMGQSPAGTSYNSEGDGVPLINGPVEFGGIDPFSKTVATKFTTKPTKMCKAGDLILCVRGSTTGRMNIAGQEACIGRGVAAIRSEENQDWVNQFISFSKNKIFSLGSGSTFPNVSGAVLKKIIIPFPPEKDRKEIVSKIENLNVDIKRIESIYQRKIAILSELKQSMLQKAFSGELTSDNKLMDEEVA